MTNEDFDLFADNSEELAPGASVEEVSALYFDPKLMVSPPSRFYRLDRQGHRYYYDFDNDGEPVFYPSITTLIAQTMPTSQYLVKWIADMGYEAADQYKNERAYYGTFMHAEIAELVIRRTYDLDGLKHRLIKYIDAKVLAAKFIDYADSLRKNMLSFAQFVIDYNVRPLAVEIALIHPLDMYACTLDMPCIISVRGKDVRAIIDFKSGKQFYETNEIQLHAQKAAWEYNYPDLPIEKVYNWRPKDWRDRPTYELTDQTNAVSREKLPHIIALSRIEDNNVDNMLTVCSGIINMDNGIKSNYKAYHLSELVKAKRQKDSDKEPDKEPEKPKVKKVVAKKAAPRKPANKPDVAKKKAPVAKTVKKATNVPEKKESAVKGLKIDKRSELLKKDLDI